jgi:dynein heavy chain
MEVSVPESARLLLLQEDKFKFYFAQLSHVVRDYEAVLAQARSSAPPSVCPVLVTTQLL